LQAFEANEGVGAVVITGSEKAFAAGADIKEMQPLTYADTHRINLFAGWDAMLRIRKPIIAAVAGYALGGGCELAMACDFIICADNAKFGQPEITLGVM
ncbi:enoyl-CoA hydratase, partial [Salmonella enterica subsp. enterica serovar Typhimurium]|nr:enoyl-CoA hydratase [Salmonella enterica subsp. enterica serovar Typhimurium]